MRWKARPKEPSQVAPQPSAEAGPPAASADWQFYHFGKKQLASLAKLLSCRTEELMDAYDEGVPVGSAYGENLAKRLRFVYGWTPDRIGQTLSRLKNGC